jgi:hypothetical protein
MSAGEETANPSAARERALVTRVVAELAGEDPVLDLGALARERPQAALILAAVRAHERAPVIACTGVLERLADFVDVVEALVATAAEHDATVVLDVPNHTAVEAGATPSVWGDGALEELRGLLPADHVVLHEVALRGAALVPQGGRVELPLVVAVDAEDAVPVAFVVAFGPRAARLLPAADVAPAGLLAERAYERARTAELEVLRAATRPVPALPNGAQPAGTAG